MRHTSVCALHTTHVQSRSSTYVVHSLLLRVDRAGYVTYLFLQYRQMRKKQISIDLPSKPHNHKKVTPMLYMCGNYFLHFQQ
jgi:hypothetical protein